MVIDNPAGAALGNGPSGFIEFEQHMLVVDHGKIYGADGAAVGTLYENGLIQGLETPFNFDGMKAIEELPGCIFRGIDARGVMLELPGQSVGPTGLLKYNGVALPVIHGRVATTDNRLVGYFRDDGKITLRDHKNPAVVHELDDYSQLNTSFQGINSKEQPFNYDWVRPLHRKDRNYLDNEIIRYFEDFDKLNTAQKSYVLETMHLWAASGILQVVRRSEGDAALGNVKHGASGVTSIRSGKVNIDREEFETEITLYKRFGALAKIQTRIKNYFEVRVNLVVSHEFGHQLEFTLSQSVTDKIEDLYKSHLSHCDRIHPLPEEYEGSSELLQMHQIEERIFISGYCRASFHEYWAECVAAFSVKQSREILKQMDQPVYDLLYNILYNPEKSLSPKFEKDLLRLQTSLRVGGELTDDLLDK